MHKTDFIVSFTIHSLKKHLHNKKKYKMGLDSVAVLTATLFCRWCNKTDKKDNMINRKVNSTSVFLKNLV